MLPNTPQSILCSQCHYGGFLVFFGVPCSCMPPPPQGKEFHGGGCIGVPRPKTQEESIVEHWTKGLNP